ncbi:hypothetical protein SAMN05444157_3579 [Frankineae bacterium MT45]|nr:hypothetical protein SAMN05444157_3579 [Frankineae bacterium MT45]
MTQPPPTIASYAMARRAWAAVACVAVYLISVLAIVVPASDAVAAHRLGADPGRAITFSVHQGCERCSTIVGYSVATTLYREPLQGSNGGVSVGDALVYNRADPRKVMTQQTWRSGRSDRWLHVTVGGGAACVFVTLLVIATGRRRRHRFGDLRPSEAVAGASYARTRSGATWTIRFGDGRRGRYLDSPMLRDALRSRASSNPMMTVNDAGEARLGGAFGVHDAPRPVRRRPALILAVAVSSGLVTAAVVGSILYHVSRSAPVQSAGTPAGTPDFASGSGCQPGDAPTAAPTAAATGYLAAVAAAMPSWLRVDASLAAHPGQIANRDLGGEVAADQIYLSKLAAITFTSPAAATEKQLATAVGNYDTILTDALGESSYLRDHRSEETDALDRRTAASALIHVELGLPPSQCSLLRP